MNREIWKKVDKYDGYIEVSNLGNVRSIIYKNGEKSIRNLTKDLGKRKDYYYVRIHNNNIGINTRVRIHRLVAEAFIPNPNNLPCVNHKNENKLDNRVENLEWCTFKYNVNYGTGIERRAYNARNQPHRSCIIEQLDLNGNVLAEYPSFKEAQRVIGHSYSNIWNCCNGRKNTAYGYKWRYKQVYSQEWT